MTVQNLVCPPESMLSDFGLGKLDAANAETVSQHLETCDDCRQRVANLSGDSFVNRLRGLPDDAGRPGRIEHTFIAGESASNVGGHTPWGDLPRSSKGKDGLGRPPSEKDGLGRPPHEVPSAPPELANHPDYELIKELGRGGMGVVYLAKNRMMDRLEVLKVVSKALLDKPGSLERFQQEIRSAAKLLHTNIVAAHAVLRLGDLLVFAMEHVPGNDLMQVVKKRGYLPVANATFYAHQVGLGLQHAHEKGMVHRDIKPNNLMLAIEGKKHVVKILDFGLAKATSEKAAETALTKSGQMLGTPDYIAPEQTLDAQKADIRADIYSLGCTLYYLLAGRPPFQEASLYALLDAHQRRDAQPLNFVRPDVPVELAAVVGKMLAKYPAKRYQTPIEVARALTPFFKPGQTVATPTTADAVPSQPAAETAHGVSAATPISPITPPPTPFLAPVIPLVATLTPVAARENTDLLSVSIDTGRPAAKRRTGWWSSLPPWQKMTAVLAAGAAAVSLLGIVLLVRTKDGAIRVEINDPQIEVAIKGTEIHLKQADNGRDIKLSAGEKTLIVERGDFKFETDKLVLKNGEIATVVVTLLDGQVKVKQGDKLLGQGKLPAVWHGWPADAPKPAIAPFGAEQAKKHQQAWADYLKVPVEHSNCIGMKFVLIPPGEFTMGSTPAEIDEALKVAGDNQHQQEGIKGEAPQHKVVLTQPIYLGVHEVTQKEYQAVIGNNPSHFAKTGPEAQLVEKVAGLETAQHPVETVSWYDAAEFCAKLSQQENLKPFYFRVGDTVTPLKGSGYRLPTEAEWEFACRAGTTSRFWSGEREQDLARAGWFGHNSGLRTHEVGELASNPLGLFDVHGNVWEWVQDAWDQRYYEQFAKNPAVNPSHPFSAGSQRVVRGGHSGCYVPYCRSSFRAGAKDPSFCTYDQGFRVALPVAAVKSSLSKHPGNVNAGWPADAPRVTARSDGSPNGKNRVAQQDSNGFVPLFNGKDLTGWEPNTDQARNWRVENGILIGSGAADSYLSSERGNFTDFHLRVEARINSGGNSGVFARTQGGADGYEAGILFDEAHPIKTGALWAPGGTLATAAVSPAGPNEWFTLEFIAVDNHLVVKVNGQTTAEYVDPGRRYRTGHIALQRYDAQTIVEFRKIEIKESGLAVGANPPGLPAAAAASTKLPATFKNSLGMEFLLVPKGKSWLGGGGGKLGDEEVEISRDFYLGKYTVTQEEWEKVMGKNPSHFSRTGGGKDAVKNISDDQLKRFPVEMVSWEDCRQFVARLNEKKDESGWTYRLPTEMEWEYACRGGPLADRFDTAFDFYFDKPQNELRPDQANFGKGDKGCTCPVGSYQPNRLGLHDMHGNVHQWCDGEARVVRGGSNHSPPGYCRAATRFAGLAAPHRANNTGLRLARVAASPAGNRQSGSLQKPPAAGSQSKAGNPALLDPPAAIPSTKDHERELVEWVLSRGGKVKLQGGDEEIDQIDKLQAGWGRRRTWPVRLATICFIIEASSMGPRR
jgi:formylglycine-generating enzyme required for sulfatase activity/serine/threonine protein kinase